MLGRLLVSYGCQEMAVFVEECLRVYLRGEKCYVERDYLMRRKFLNGDGRGGCSLEMSS